MSGSEKSNCIVQICSFQSRLAPPEHRRWRRCHGLQFPLHPQQIAGWIVLMTIGIATFVILLPALRGNLELCLLIILSILFIIHIGAHVTALLLDPADPDVRVMPSRMVPEFDRTKHGHVIENGRCHLCNIRTRTERTKHCSVCNKCVDNFDHHCKWLNHCIGGRNYGAFIVCVISAVIASLMIVGTAITELVFFHMDPNCLDFLTPTPVFLTIISGLGLLSAATSVLLLHLCLFHAYISFLGITTYEYIRSYRQGTPIKCTVSCRKKDKTLTRQNTDPEFIDRAVKPFVVQLPEERPANEHQFDIREILKLCPRMNFHISRGFKTNQVRPTTEEELNRTMEKIAALTNDKQSMKMPILPVLLPPSDNKTMTHSIKSLLDLAEIGALRTPRRTLKTRPHTPSLSPIRESGLSNPASPRLIPDSNVSKIFLSQPTTPCSSDEELDEPDEGLSCHSGHTIRPEDLLKTPQLPRKVYSPRQVFVCKSGRTKRNTIDCKEVL